MNVGIVGFGHVGGVMSKLFVDATVYDKHKGIGSREEINGCQAAFVCVPTPLTPEGRPDVTAVDEVVSWCKCPVIIIRSTVPVGYTAKMCRTTGKKIVFQPEYYGETTAHPLCDLSQRKWLTFGGEDDAIDLAVKVYQTVMSADVRIVTGTSDEAELAKLVENAFLAAKVTLFNSVFDACIKEGMSYHRVREMVVADPRIGPDHTFVYPENRGFGGSCLPKDTKEFTRFLSDNGTSCEMMTGMLSQNAHYRSDIGRGVHARSK